MKSQDGTVLVHHKTDSVNAAGSTAAPTHSLYWIRPAMGHHRISVDPFGSVLTGPPKIMSLFKYIFITVYPLQDSISDQIIQDSIFTLVGLYTSEYMFGNQAM